MGMSADQVYNADESGLFWKLLPDKTLVRANEKAAPGRKISKERITFVACTNSSGAHKVNLFIIGKAKKPRAFKNFNMSKIVYRGNKNPWMTSLLFQTWLESTFAPQVKQFLISRGFPCKALLLLDNAPCHPRSSEIFVEGLHITIMCMPPNCTALLQPMDQNVINITKLNYKTSLLAHLVASNENGLDSAIKCFNIKHAVNLLANAWEGLTETTIKSCWKILMRPRYDEWDSEDELPLMELRKRQQNQNTDVEILQTLLNEFSPIEQITNGDIEDWIGEVNLGGPNPISSDEESIDSDTIISESSNQPIIKLHEAIKSFTICLDWANQNNATMEELMILQKLREQAVMRQNICLKQSKIFSKVYN